MAATGKTPILLYGSTTATNAPIAGNLTNSSDGCEIAINVADKNLFFKDSTNTVNTVPIRQSSASSNGWLSSTDWSTFNGKQPAGSYALTTGTLAQFTSTTSAQLAGVISDETGSGSLVFGTGPTLTNAVYKLSGNGATFGISDTAGTAVNQYFDCTLAPGGGAYNYLKFNFGGNDILTWGYTLSAYANTLTLNAPTSSGNIVFKNNGTQVGTFDTGTNLQVSTGNLVIGTSGKGIDFSATAGTGTSELLADYEEGTWNAVISDGTNNATMSNTTCRYTKIGRIVTLAGRITTTSIGSVTGGIVITGLPYAIGAFSSSMFGYGSNFAITAGQSVGCYGSSSTYVTVSIWTATTGITQMTATQWGNTGDIVFNFTYSV